MDNRGSVPGILGLFGKLPRRQHMTTVGSPVMKPLRHRRAFFQSTQGHPKRFFQVLGLRS